MGILLFSFSVSNSVFCFLFFLTLDFQRLPVGLLNERVGITLNTLQLGAKLLSKRTVQTKETAGPVDATNFRVSLSYVWTPASVCSLVL